VLRHHEISTRSLGIGSRAEQSALFAPTARDDDDCLCCKNPSPLVILSGGRAYASTQSKLSCSAGVRARKRNPERSRGSYRRIYVFVATKDVTGPRPTCATNDYTLAFSRLTINPSAGLSVMEPSARSPSRSRKVDARMRPCSTATSCGSCPIFSTIAKC
jgi:hypothetical protein